MNESMVSENQQIFDSGYLEQKNQEVCQIDSANKRYFHRLHYINLQSHPRQVSTMILFKDWREMEPLKSLRKNMPIRMQEFHFLLRVKAFFNGDAKSELETKKKQAEAIHEADTKTALDSYNKRAKRFYENRKQQHDGVNRLHEMMQQGDVEQIAAYFAFALQQDDYSTDFVNQFQIDVADRSVATRIRNSFVMRIGFQTKKKFWTFSTFVCMMLS